VWVEVGRIILARGSHAGRSRGRQAGRQVGRGRQVAGSQAGRLRGRQQRPTGSLGQRQADAGMHTEALEAEVGTERLEDRQAY
jgi:hypothetical protein